MPKSNSSASKYRKEVVLYKEHAAKLHRHLKPNISSYAKAHNLGYKRLLRAYNNAPTRSDKKPTNCRLNDTQDLALERYLDAINAIGFGIHHRMIAQQAYALLQESYIGPDESPPPLGNNWARRWLQRHQKYRRIKTKPMEVQRMLAQQPDALRQWFEQLQATIEQLGVQHDDMYNMDETGCRIGVASSQYVYSTGGQQVFIANANNRELITLVECVCSTGFAIEPMVIIKAATIMEQWVVDLPNNYLIATSESGYSNDELALAWLKHFDRRTKQRSTGAWRLLLVDGHGSHSTREFIQYAEQQHIQLFALPPHTTHLLQPLDVGCFQPLKWYHGRCLEWASRTGSKDINKADFLATLAEIRRLTFTRTTIQSGWRRTGLAPWKPELVLDQLQLRDTDSEYERATPPPAQLRQTTPCIQSSSPPLGSSPSCPLPLQRFTQVRIALQSEQLSARRRRRRARGERDELDWDTTPEPENPRPGDAAWVTPKTVRQIQAQEPFVYAVLREHLPRDVAASVIKHQRGVSAIARIAEGLQRELHHTEAAQLAKGERRRRKRRALEAGGGPIYSQDARLLVQRRQVNDVARLQQELAARSLREVTTIGNKWKRIRPTIRNWGKRYLKRAASGVTIMRDVTCWQYAINDCDYNTKAQYKLQRVQEDRSVKYNESMLTTDNTEAAEVAAAVRRQVCPYQLLCQLSQHQDDSNDDDITDREDELLNIHEIDSPCPRIESQQSLSSSKILDKIASYIDSSDYDHDYNSDVYSSGS